jgi:phosphatidylethanolamine-binding protein (PEBP) family uncharacterized protein
MKRAIVPAARLLLSGLAQAQFRLIIEGLPNGGSIPTRFTCDAAGGGVSPALRWSGEPAGTNSFGDRGYGGPCPPPGGGSHTYVFRLFALDSLERAIRKHVLAKAEYRLKYGH